MMTESSLILHNYKVLCLSYFYLHAKVRQGEILEIMKMKLYSKIDSFARL